MDTIQQQSMAFPEGARRPRRLRRGIFLLPSILTGLNLLCGYYAAIAALMGRAEDFDHAAKAIGIAILFDSLDGRIARMTGTNTEFGVQFDSLADVVSFGIAPAILAYAWGYRSMVAGNSDSFLGHFAWLCCLAFLICSAWRLARFNVKGMEPGGNKNFVGMPTPAAAGMVAAIVHACHWYGPIDNQRWSYVWFVLLVALGALMTSTIRYYSFKDVPWARKQPSITIIVIVMLAAIAYRYSEYFLVIFAGTYAVAGIILHILRMFRHRTVTRTA